MSRRVYLLTGSLWSAVRLENEMWWQKLRCKTKGWDKHKRGSWRSCDNRWRGWLEITALYSVCHPHSSSVTFRCPGVSPLSYLVDRSASSEDSTFRDNTCAECWKYSSLESRTRRMLARIVECCSVFSVLLFEIVRPGWRFGNGDEARKSDIERGCERSSHLFGNALQRVHVLSSKRGRRSMPLGWSGAICMSRRTSLIAQPLGIVNRWI